VVLDHSRFHTPSKGETLAAEAEHPNQIRARKLATGNVARIEKT
jgi:hypothetical protein